MGMSETVAKLRQLSDDELVRLHDAHAKNTVVGTAHYLGELERRHQQRATDAMLGYTRQITRLTVVITIATVVNLILIAVTLVR